MISTSRCNARIPLKKTQRVQTIKPWDIFSISCFFCCAIYWLKKNGFTYLQAANTLLWFEIRSLYLLVLELWLKKTSKFGLAITVFVLQHGFVFIHFMGICRKKTSLAEVKTHRAVITMLRLASND